MSSPLITVIVPAYNQESYLSEAIESILAQTYSNLEVIIIDDGSQDQTYAICQSYQARDRRIRTLSQSNRGPSAARNRGILEAKGPYICFLDGDDIMEGSRIEKELLAFERDYRVGIVYSAVRLIDFEGKPLGEIHSPSFLPENFLSYLFFRNLVPSISTTMIKRQLLLEHLFDESLRYAEDYDLIVRLAHHTQVAYIDTPLLLYRRHSHNLSHNLAAHRQTELQILKRYGPEHIAAVVQGTSLPDEDKGLLLGKIFFNMEEIEKSIYLLKALPHSALAAFYLGNCYFVQEHSDEALASYLRSIILDPSNAASHNNLGVIYARKHHNQQAFEHFTKALELKPGYCDPQANLKNLKLEEPDWKVTLRELRPTLMPYKMG